MESLSESSNSAFEIGRSTQSASSPSKEQLSAESEEIEKDKLNDQLNHYGNRFYTQLYTQNVRNKSCITMHEEELKNFIVDIQSRGKTTPLVKICDIERWELFVFCINASIIQCSGEFYRTYA